MNVTTLHLAMSMPSFFDDAACRDTTGVDFFAERDWHETERAKAVCATCPIQAECLQWSLDTRQKHGVWGGQTPGQRERTWRGHRSNHGH